MKTILIVEDENAYSKILYTKLSNQYKIILAQNGKQGLTMALSQKPDLILLDVLMPVMGGMTMLKELRKDSYGRQAKVIMFTNLEADNRITVQVSKDLPTYYFVKSNIDLDYLLDKIQELLQPEEEKVETN